MTLDLGLDALTVPQLLLDPAGRIDLGAGRLTVAAGPAESAVRQLLIDGYNGGGWNGSRGFVSRAAAVAGRAVGYAVDQGQVTIAYAVAGDTNLDGIVDVLDIPNLVAGFTASDRSAVAWSSGDFNYDGFVDDLDISELLATGVFGQGEYLSAADAAFAALGSETT